MSHPHHPVPVTASGLRPEAVAVAGVALPAARERELDHTLLALARGLADHHGVTATWLATHRTVVGGDVRCTGTVGTGPAGDTGVTAERLRTAVAALGYGGADGHRAAAVAAFTARTEGRVVRFPGGDATGGRVRVGDLRAGTAVEVVTALGVAAPGEDAVIETRGFLRPRFEAGWLVLHVQPARGGVFVPFETPSPTPCCVDHR